MKILVLNGPNLNRLGLREPDHDGTTTLEQLEASLSAVADALGIEVVCRQSNSEGTLIDWLHQADTTVDGVLLNAAAYTHYSYSLRDAIASIEPPVVEIHISHVHRREAFRAHSVIARVCIGGIWGLGVDGYEWGLRALHRQLQDESEGAASG